MKKSLCAALMGLCLGFGLVATVSSLTGCGIESTPGGVSDDEAPTGEEDVEGAGEAAIE